MLNLAKLTILKNTNPKLVDVFAACTRGRHCNHMNQLVGEDLKLLLPWAATHHIEYPEEQRVVARHRNRPGSIRMAPCLYHSKPGGCRQGDECEYLHLDKD